jgi:hypothetical protein
MEDEVQNDQDAITEFATYEDFLDSQISTLDLFYLEVILFIKCLLKFQTKQQQQQKLKGRRVSPPIS